MPSMTGIRMSMSTTSMRLVRTAATASRPLSTSPTVSMSSAESISIRKPLRTSD